MTSPDAPGMPARDEARRRDAVRRVLGEQATSAHLDRLTRLSAELLDAPLAQVSLLTDEQHVASLVSHGLVATPSPTEATGPLEESLCTVTAGSGAPLLVQDAPADARVAHLPPVVTGQVGAYLGVPLVGHGGHVLGALCVYDPRPRHWSEAAVSLLSELSQSVVAELELRALSVEAEQDAARLELALEAADIGSFDLDVATSQLVWDERLVRLFGYDPRTFVAHLDSFWVRVHPEDRDRMADAIRHTVENGADLSTEYRVVRPDGTTRWVEARGRVLGVEGAQRLLGVAYDSTELRVARDRLARVLETMTDAFYSLDRSWRFTYVNRQAETLLRRPRGELLGSVFWEQFPDAVGSPVEEHYRHALENDEPVTFEAYDATLDGWNELSVWPGPDGLSVYFRDVTARRTAAVERERAYSEREQAVAEKERAYVSVAAADERLRLVAAGSDQLSRSLRPEDVLSTLASIVVDRGLARWMGVALTAETAGTYRDREPSGDLSRLELVMLSASDSETEERLGRALALLPLSVDDPAGVGAAVRTGRAEWLPTVSDDLLVALAPDDRSLEALRELAVGSALSLPLLNRGQALGAVSFGEPVGGVMDRELLEGLVGRAAVALDNALLYRTQQRTSLTLQQSLLPRDVPAVPGVRTAARYLPGATGAQVGGDWYQGVRVGDRLLVAMGDVMGHGMRSAARMGQLRAIVSTLALEGHGAGALLARLADNVEVLLELELATLLVAVLDPVTGTLTVASAGHPPPLVVPPDAAPGYVDVEPGPPLGTFPGSYPESVVTLAPGSSVLLYTDGLVEQRDASLDAGLSRLRAAVQGLRLPPDGLAEEVLRSLGRTQGAADDVALLVLSWQP